MNGCRFQGKSYPDSNSRNTPQWSPTAVLTSADGTDLAGRWARRQEFAAWLSQCAAVPAVVPIWLSRRAWIASVIAWADTDEGRAALRAAHLSAARFARVVRVLARFADGTSGRNVAVTNARIAAMADVCVRIVQTARGILGTAGWAVEASRGYGHPGGRRNRPSVWHLVSRREPVCALPSNSSYQRVCHAGKNSPSAAHRRRRENPVPKKHSGRREVRRPEVQPRNLHTQRLAAYLAAHCLGLSAAHPGRWCDVLERSHLRLTDWTGAQLVSAMNATMRERGWHWPDRINNPAGFLAFRLAQLPPMPPGGISAPRSPRNDPEPAVMRASAEVRAAALAEIREILSRRKSAA